MSRVDERIDGLLVEARQIDDDLQVVRSLCDAQFDGRLGVGVIGAGKVGCELPGMSADDVPYQISQRADFFEEEVGLETTLKRPIVNTRDEPHCDASKYRRLHVIVGDANMSEVATYLKVGATAIVLAMIEDDVMGDDLALANPVGAIRQVSADPALKRSILLRSGRRAGHRV